MDKSEYLKFFQHSGALRRLYPDWQTFDEEKLKEIADEFGFFNRTSKPKQPEKSPTTRELLDARLLLKELYPEWNNYSEETRKKLAENNGLPYQSAAPAPKKQKDDIEHGIFTKVFEDYPDRAHLQCKTWMNNMKYFYPTFYHLDTSEYPVLFGLEYCKLKIIVTYRI